MTPEQARLGCGLTGTLKKRRENKGGKMNEPKKESVVEAGVFRAIFTKYFGPAVKGSRIKAIAGDGGPSVTLSYDDRLSSEENHAAACKALVDKLNWGGRWTGGATKDGYAFVDCGGGRA